MARADNALASARGACLGAALHRTLRWTSLFPMKLRTDLLKFLTMEDIAEEALANNHRYKPEPDLAKTGVGSLLPATPEERALELVRNQELIERLKQRQREANVMRSAMPED